MKSGRGSKERKERRKMGGKEGGSRHDLKACVHDGGGGMWGGGGT